MKPVIFHRRDVDVVPITKGELVVLLDQLNNIENEVIVDSNFFKELLKMAINNFNEKTNTYEGSYYDV